MNQVQGDTVDDEVLIEQEVAHAELFRVNFVLELRGRQYTQGIALFEELNSLYYLHDVQVHIFGDFDPIVFQENEPLTLVVVAHDVFGHEVFLRVGELSYEWLIYT